MTFEQWWASLKNRPIPQLKPTFAECWNAALDAYDALISEKAIDPDGLHGVDRAEIEAKP